MCTTSARTPIPVAVPIPVRQMVFRHCVGSVCLGVQWLPNWWRAASKIYKCNMELPMLLEMATHSIAMHRKSIRERAQAGHSGNKYSRYECGCWHAIAAVNA